MRFPGTIHTRDVGSIDWFHGALIVELAKRCGFLRAPSWPSTCIAEDRSTVSFSELADRLARLLSVLDRNIASCLVPSPTQSVLLGREQAEMRSLCFNRPRGLAERPNSPEGGVWPHGGCWPSRLSGSRSGIASCCEGRALSGDWGEGMGGRGQQRGQSGQHLSNRPPPVEQRLTEACLDRMDEAQGLAGESIWCIIGLPSSKGIAKGDSWTPGAVGPDSW